MSDYFKILHKKTIKFKSRFEQYGLVYSLKSIVHHIEDRIFILGFIITILLYPFRFVRSLIGYYKRYSEQKISPKIVIKILYELIHQKYLYYRGEFIEYIIKIHPDILSFVCIHAYLLRKWLKPVKISPDKKIKVLHITGSFDLGGTQRQIMNICENNDNSNFIHQTIEAFPERNYLYRKEITLDRDKYIRGNFISRKLGSLVLNPSWRSLQLVQVYKFICDFNELRPDVVVGWSHEIAMISFIAASIARVSKIIFCIRTFNPSLGWTPIGPLLESAHKSMMPYVNGIIVNSSQLQNDYAEWMNIPENGIHVCANGIEFHPLTMEERLTYRRKIRSWYSIPDDAVVILNIGRFSKEKGQMLLVRAFRKVIDKCSSHTFFCFLCGDGPTQSEVTDYINTSSLNNVFLTGRVDNIFEYFCAADIFVMSSDFEGMPNAMMEAMAYGLPSVSTNRTGALDIARDNMEALYIDVGSEVQLVEKLVYLIEKPEERNRMGANAKERLKDFSIPPMISKFNSNLEEIISTPNPFNL